MKVYVLPFKIYSFVIVCIGYKVFKINLKFPLSLSIFKYYIKTSDIHIYIISKNILLKQILKCMIIKMCIFHKLT